MYCAHGAGLLGHKHPVNATLVPVLAGNAFMDAVAGPDTIIKNLEDVLVKIKEEGLV